MAASAQDAHPWPIWAAGFIDGEGCIRISHKVRVSVLQVDPRPLIQLQVLFGGSIRINRHSTGPKRRRIYVWEIGSRQARTMLEQILPFLIVKKDQAELALEHDKFGRAKRNSLNGAEGERRIAIRNKLKELKWKEFEEIVV